MPASSPSTLPSSLRPVVQPKSSSSSAQRSSSLLPHPLALASPLQQYQPTPKTVPIIDSNLHATNVLPNSSNHSSVHVLVSVKSFTPSNSTCMISVLCSTSWLKTLMCWWFFIIPQLVRPFSSSYPHQDSSYYRNSSCQAEYSFGTK